ncbi:hypothetical protein LINPERHAP1_LOCUS26129 [Linum perenne]
MLISISVQKDERERVREKKRESEAVRGPERRGLGGGGGGGGGGGVESQDQFKRLFQLRNHRISIEASKGLFDSDFRLEVARGPSSHFVFLDRRSLSWLEGILQVVSNREWNFKKEVGPKSSRRTISVERLSLFGFPVLKVSEKCVNGKVFFVNIPAESVQGGWLRFLRLVKDCSLATSKGEKQSFGSKSFAQVVAGSSFSKQGVCSLAKLGGLEGIRVEKEGVAERVKYLAGCLVFRFRSSEKVDWELFRKWIVRSWGVGLDAPIQRLGDNLWLLSCGSEVSVQRILALNWFWFGDIEILLDVWIPEAGRSRVLLEEDVVWVTIRGIPIHLRSPELFRQLGEFCGSFIQAEDEDSLSSIRVCLKLRGSIPEEIPLLFEEMVFPLRVEPETVVPRVKLLKGCLSAGGACSKGKEALVPRVRWQESEDRLEGGKSSVVGSSSAGKSSPSHQLCLDQPFTLGSEIMVSKKAVERLSDRVEVDIDRGVANLSVGSAPSVMSAKGSIVFVGFRLEQNENLVCSLSGRLGVIEVELINGPWASSFGPWFASTKQSRVDVGPVRGLDSCFVLPDDLGWGKGISLDSFLVSNDLLVSGGLSARQSTVLRGNERCLDRRILSGEVDSQSCPPQIQTLVDSSGELQKIPEAILADVAMKRVGDLIGLSEAPREGLDSPLYQRSSSGRSRLQLEHRRLDYSPDLMLSGKRRSSRERYGSSSANRYEF